MPSLRSALTQLDRFTRYSLQYLEEYLENLRLQAEHGVLENGQWYMSSEADRVFTGYGRLLSDAYLSIREELERQKSKREALDKLRRTRIALQRQLQSEEKRPQFNAFESRVYACYEMVDVLYDILRGNQYIPHGYRQWNNPKLNRLYHTPYILDKDALHGIIFEAAPQTRIVLFPDRLQVRWGEGRVLLDLPYAAIMSIEEVRSRRKRLWTVRRRDGTQESLDVRWVFNLAELRSQLERFVHPVQVKGEGPTRTA